MKGIDVSKHNGVIDWNKVKESGIEFAIIRAGYGKNNVDKQFIHNICCAHSAGLKISVYWFLYALNEEDAIANAEKCDRTISLYKDIIDMVFADWEYDSDEYSSEQGVTQSKTSRTSIVRAFLERMQAKGYSVGNYANPDYINRKFGDLSEYPLWLAWYKENADVSPYNPLIWQYSSTGSVTGIKGNVDLNIGYSDFTVPVIEYYPVPEFTLIDHLNKIGVDSSLESRKKIARVNGIINYTGTKEQNLILLEQLKAGKLIKA